MAKILKSKTQALKRTQPPLKSKKLPATYGALDKFRGELKSDVTGVKLQMSAFEKRMTARLSDVDAQFKKMDVHFAEIKSSNQRMLALLEEQESRNRFALDGYASVYERQSALEKRVSVVEKNQFDLAKYIKSEDV